MATHPTRRHLLGGMGSLLALAGHRAWAHGPAHTTPPTRVVAEQKPWGIAGHPDKATRTVTVRMLDTMRFTPDTLVVREGETLRLVVHNTGQVLHELVIGTTEELASHAALMKKHPGMQHDEPYMAHVDPQQRGQLTWTFNRPGVFAFACLLPGHFEAGMTGRITVTPRT